MLLIVFPRQSPGFCWNDKKTIEFAVVVFIPLPKFQLIGHQTEVQDAYCLIKVNVVIILPMIELEENRHILGYPWVIGKGVFEV